jgi:nicotinamidase-related amidase
MQAGVGHYGVFSGNRWTNQIYPLVRNVILASERSRRNGAIGPELANWDKLRSATQLLQRDTAVALRTIAAEPAPLAVNIERAALIIIDMQRDFLLPGGFGAALGNDVSRLNAAVGPCREVLAAARKAGVLVMHTREGHRPDLSDAPPVKVERGDPALRIGAAGPMGRILVRGEPGHDIIPELYPQAGEPVIDKPGKGAFYQTDLELLLKNRGIETLLVCGVTTEVCVNTTVREANDRGFRCIVLSDCCASYFPEFHDMGLKMIAAQGGIFGSVSASAPVIAALSQS